MNQVLLRRNAVTNATRKAQKRPEVKEKTLYDQIYGVFETHIDARPHYLVGLTLWAFHTHVYKQFQVSPRLAVLSPMKNCGKSTILDILKEMAATPKFIVEPTHATLFRLAEKEFTLLLDEGDNIRIKDQIKAILNAGHRANGQVPRVVKGEVEMWNVFCPVAIAGIGSLPDTLLSRSIIIHMFRSDQKPRFNSKEAYYHGAIAKWAAEVNLNEDPPLPVKGRTADNWRPLVSIADSFGRGEEARAAMRIFIAEQNFPDITEMLIYDVHRVFEETGAELLPSSMLFRKLIDLQNGEYEWSIYKFTRRDMTKYISGLGIDSKPYRWPEKTSKPVRCYFRADFEEKWKRLPQTKTVTA